MRQSAELAKKVQDALAYQLSEKAKRFLFDDTGEEEPEVNMAMTYEEVGMLTMDKGLVLEMSDGSRVQLTIVAYDA